MSSFFCLIDTNMKTQIETNSLKACEVTLTYKTNVKPSERSKISNSNDAYNLLVDKFYSNETIEHKEIVKAILLNKAHKVLGVINISEGGIDSSIIDCRLVLQAAILANATSVILTHNHPSGNVNPSECDIRMTSELKNACDLMKICLLDHIIVTKESYFSLVDEGKI